MKYIYIVLFTILIACQSNNKLLVSFDKESKDMVDSLNKYKYVESESVGFGGDESELYKFFIQFQEKLSTDKLVLLTGHTNPTVRVYAFWALCNKKYPDFKKILDDHISDKKTFHYLSGCIGSTENVNEFYLTLVNPEATVYDCIKLSKEEFESYSKKIIK